MPSTDITKCANGEKCLRKDTCWRYLCPTEMLQSYADLYEGDGELCLYYYPVAKEDKKTDDNK